MPTANRPQRRNRFQPALEQLETRLTPASAKVITGKILEITGETNAWDQIQVRKIGSDIAVSSQWQQDVGNGNILGGASEQRFKASDVTGGIRIYGQSKNDSILVSVDYIPVLVDAGSGNDIVTVRGTGVVTVNGGAGNDWLFANGDDTLNGQDGNDYLFGNGRTDILQGGTGTNYLSQGQMPEAVALKWREFSGTLGAKADTVGYGSGYDYYDFAGGRIYHNTSTNQAFAVYGAIGQHLRKVGSSKDLNGNSISSVLGMAKGDETNVPGYSGARVSRFNGGDIYWSSNTNGAHVVIGAIRTKYNSHQSKLGLPTTDEIKYAWGCMQQYQTGAIYYIARTRQTYIVYGDVWTKYLQLKNQGVNLGLPTADTGLTVTTKQLIGSFTSGRIISSGSLAKTTWEWTTASSLTEKTKLDKQNIDLRNSSLAETIKNYLNKYSPSIGNRGWTRIDELSLNTDTDELTVRFTVSANHSWGKPPAWLWPIIGKGEIAGGVEAAGVIKINYQTKEIKEWKVDLDAVVGGTVGQKLRQWFGYDQHIRLTLDEATINDIKTVMSGDLTPVFNRAVDHLTDDDYSKVKSGLEKQYGASNVGFASKDFVTWAGPATLVRYGITIAASGGAGIGQVAAELRSRLEQEWTKTIQPFLNKRASSYAESMKAEVFAALLQQRDVDMGYFAIKWTTVQYRYGFGDAVVGANHLAYAIVWKG